MQGTIIILYVYKRYSCYKKIITKNLKPGGRADLISPFFLSFCPLLHVMWCECWAWIMDTLVKYCSLGAFSRQAESTTSSDILYLKCVSSA